MNVVFSFGIFLWFFIASVSYYILFPPLTLIKEMPLINSFQITGHALGHIFILLLFLISAIGWGSLFFKSTHLTRLERYIFSIALGFGFLSFIVFAAGLIGFTGKLFYFSLLLGGSLIFMVTTKNYLGDYAKYKNPWLLLALAPVISSLIGALAPATQFDSLVYHLALPAKYLSAGKFLKIDNNFFFAFPQGLEMLFQMALALDGEELANLIHWSFLPLTALALIAFGRRFWNFRTGFIAAVIWLFTPSLLFLSTGTYVDLGLAYFVFCAFFAAGLWIYSHHTIWIYFAGVFSGIALSIKYTAGAAIIALLFTIFVSAKKGSKPFRNSLIIILTAFAVFSPWLIKNYIFLNNPVAPWGTKYFNNSPAVQNTAGTYFEHIKGHGMNIESIKDLLLLPWNLTAYGFKYGGGFDIMGPVFLLFLPLLFLREKIDRIARAAIVFVAVFCFIWFISGKVLRFLVPIMPFLALFAAKGFESYQQSSFQKAVSYTVIALAFTHNLLLYHWNMAVVDPYSVVIGKLSKHDYLSRKLNYFNSVDDCVNALPPRSKVAFLGETRGLYVKADSIVPTVFDKNPVVEWANQAKSAGELHSLLKINHITHIFENNFEVKRLGLYNQLTKQGSDNLASLKNSFSKIIFKDPYCDVYEISS